MLYAVQHTLHCLLRLNLLIVAVLFRTGFYTAFEHFSAAVAVAAVVAAAVDVVDAADAAIVVVVIAVVIAAVAAAELEALPS